MTKGGEGDRYRRLAYVVILLFAFLTLRLWQLQVVRGESFAQMAEGNRIRTIPIRAPRGSIYDRNGKILATNRLAYTVSVVPSGMRDDKDVVIDRLARLIDMPPDEIREIIDKGGGRPYVPIRIKRDIPVKTVVAVEEARSRLPGVLVEDEWVREYPNGEVAGHTLGYLGLADMSDVEAGYSPTDLVGKDGLESAYEGFLRGRDGERRVEVNALSRPIRELGVTPPVPGMNIYLTLDLDLQQKVTEILRLGLERIKEESEANLAGAGAAVVMSAKTGDVLAMASYPYLDPGKLVSGERAEYVDKLNKSPFSPWLNLSMRAFPPGSTFKIVTGIAALESGTITPQTVYNADGYHKYGKKDWTIHAGLPPAGPVTIVEALGRSTDDFFWEMSLRPQVGGIKGLAEWARKFGLGKRTGVTINPDDEMAGLVPDPEWKRRELGEPWYEPETMDVAIGQGFLTVTPIQLAELYQAFANDGAMYRPRLVEKVSASDASARFSVDIEVRDHIRAKKSSWGAIRDGLRSAVQWRRGTAYRAFAGASYDPAGKTGSAQTSTAAHGWFAGFAPAADPEIVVVVFAEYGESGSRAAPIAREIMDAYFLPDKEANDQG